MYELTSRRRPSSSDPSLACQCSSKGSLRVVYRSMQTCSENFTWLHARYLARPLLAWTRLVARPLNLCPRHHGTWFLVELVNGLFFVFQRWWLSLRFETNVLTNSRSSCSISVVRWPRKQRKVGQVLYGLECLWDRLCGLQTFLLLVFILINLLRIPRHASAMKLELGTPFITINVVQRTPYLKPQSCLLI